MHQSVWLTMQPCRSGRRFRVAGVLFACGVVGLTLSAQAQEGDVTSPFSETVDVQVINLEVVVTDADGNPVHDLAADAFQLVVDGREASVDYFSEVRRGIARPQALAEAPASPRGTQPKPNAAAGEMVGTSYLLFVDQFFGIGRDVERVLGRIRSDVADFGPGDHLAIVAYDGRRLRQVAGWTSGQQAIDRVLTEAAGMKTLGLQRMGERNLLDRQSGGAAASLIQGSRTEIYRDYLGRLQGQVDRVLKAATTSLRTFARAPGRKVLLLTSGGWPTEILRYAIGTDRLSPVANSYTSRTAFDNLVGTANLLGYTIYPIDLPGRVSQGNVRADEALAAAGERSVRTGDQRLQGRALSAARENEAEVTLIRLAEATGGVPLINGGRDTALADVRADVASYYWLGFTPTRRKDDANHSIEVVMTRPGLKARSRASFRDLSRRTDVTMQVESHLLFETALKAKPLSATLGKPSKAPGAGVHLPVILEIPMDEVTMLPTAEGFRAELELRVAIVDEQGDRNSIPVIPIRFSGAQKPAPGQHITYETTLLVRKDKQHLVLAVHDLVGDTILATKVDFHPKKMR